MNLKRWPGGSGCSQLKMRTARSVATCRSTMVVLSLIKRVRDGHSTEMYVTILGLTKLDRKIQAQRTNTSSKTRRHPPVSDRWRKERCLDFCKKDASMATGREKDGRRAVGGPFLPSKEYKYQLKKPGCVHMYCTSHVVSSVSCH